MEPDKPEETKPETKTSVGLMERVREGVKEDIELLKS